MLGALPPISIHEWMRPSMIPFKDDLSFKDDYGKRYKWKGNSPGRPLELFSDDDGFKQPIARFKKFRIDHKADPPAPIPATLTLTERAAEIRDTVVTSFLFLEKTRRTNETASQNRADVLGAPPLTVNSSYNLRNGGV